MTCDPSSIRDITTVCPYYIDPMRPLVFPFDPIATYPDRRSNDRGMARPAPVYLRNSHRIIPRAVDNRPARPFRAAALIYVTCSDSQHPVGAPPIDPPARI